MNVVLTVVLGIFMSQAHAQDHLIQDLKQEIMAMAKTYEGLPDQSGEYQKQIEAKVQDLEKILPYSTMQEKAAKISGAWRQVFGPYSATGDGTIPFGANTANIYQIIFPEGIFYNVALYQVAKLRTVILLKGSYKVTDEAIEGTFTRNSILYKDIPSQGLHTLAQKLEEGKISPLHLPRNLKPVGLGGQLIEVYSDANMRILRGKTASFIRPALYIMERAK